MVSRRSRTPVSIERFDVSVGDDSLVVISTPVHDPASVVPVLTPAERAVARDAIAGHANVAIARRRGSSPRTVANQLASVYRKLGVASRAALAAKLLDR